MSYVQYRITIGRSKTHRLSKEYNTSSDGSLFKIEGGDRNYYHWFLESHEFTSDQALIEKLRDIQRNANLCLINGLLAPWVLPDMICRKLAAVDHKAKERTIIDGYVRHLILDFDDVVGEGLGIGSRFRESAAFIDSSLPSGLAGTRKIVLRSPSSGTKPDSINMRMIVPLTIAVTLNDATIWQKGSAAAGFLHDPAQGRLGQIAYTAAPIIFGGGLDPIADEDRIFVINPEAGASEIDIHEFDDIAAKVEKHQRTVLNEAMPLGWRYAANELIGSVVKADSYSRFYEPLSAVLGLAARSGENADTIADFLLPLIKQRVQASDPKDVRGRISYYDRKFIHQHLNSFWRRDSQTNQAISAARARIFEA